MVDPRIYRGGLVLIAVAVIVFGFSLESPPGPVTTSLVPPAYAGPSLGSLNHAYPERTPGSRDDDGLAAYIAGQLSAAGAGPTGFMVRTLTESLETASGARPVQTVIASRSGATTGTIVVVSDRDQPGEAGISGTAVLIGLSRALASQTLTHPVMLVSTGAAAGAAGASALARSLVGSGQPVDAAIVLGDLAAAHPAQPFVDPFADAVSVAPPLLALTASHYVAAQTGLSVRSPSLAAQLAQLAMPLSLTDQGPLAARGIPAVLLSLAGGRLPTAAEPVDGARPAQLFAAAMQTVDALDAAPPVPAPSAYLVLGGKIVPLWAVRLLVLVLILPVAMVAIDALARAQRQGHSTARWLIWALAGALPFLGALAVVLLAGGVGWLAAPPALVSAASVPFTGLVTMIAAALALIAGFAWMRVWCLRLVVSRIPASSRQRPSSPPDDGAAAALSIVVCMTAAIVWLINPFAALLLVPAVHAWVWLSRAEVRARRWPCFVLALIGVAPLILLCGFDAHSLGLMSPLRFAWSATTLVAGGGVPIDVLVTFSVFLGCAVGVVIVAARASRATTTDARNEPAVTIRGPIGYAGPGSLGGTESAIRRSTGSSPARNWESAPWTLSR